MTIDAHANFGYGLVTVAPSPAASGLTLSVSSAVGALLPAAPCNLTVWPTGVLPTKANAEIVRMTANASGALTIVRAQEGTTARTILVGDQIAATITAKTLTDVETSIPTPVTTDAAPGSSKTLTVPTTGSIAYDLTGSAASCALTFAGATAGKLCTITVIERQDSTAGRAFTYGSNVSFPGQAIPSHNLSAGKYDVLQFTSVDGGTTWIGTMIASAVQPFTAPSAPVSVAVQASSTQNIVTWADTSNGGSAITGHNIYRGTSSGGETLLASNQSSPYTDSGLTNGTQYYYKVTAVNAIGEGAQSAEAGAAADHYLNIPAASGASTPYQASIGAGVSTPLDLRALIQHATYTFSGNNFLLTSSSATATNSIAILYIDANGKLNAAWYTTAGSQQNCVSTMALPFAANDTRWVRALMNPGAGTCDFYTSIDGTTWTALGAQVTGKTTTAVLTPGTGVIVTVGQRSDAAAQFTGRIWKVRWIVNSVPVLTMDFSANSGTGPWTATTGETWTRIGTAAIV